MKLASVLFAITTVSAVAAWQPKFEASGFVKKMPGKPEKVHVSQSSVPREAYVRGMDLGQRPVFGISQDHVYDKKMTFDQELYSKQQQHLNSNVGYHSSGMVAFANQAAQVTSTDGLKQPMDLGQRPANGIHHEVQDHKMFFDQQLYSKQQHYQVDSAAGMATFAHKDPAYGVSMGFGQRHHYSMRPDVDTKMSGLGSWADQK